MDWIRKNWPLILLPALMALLCVLFIQQVRLLLSLLFGAAVIAFILRPLADFYAKKLHSQGPISLALAYLSVGAGLALALFLLIPALIGQLSLLTAQLPVLLRTLRGEAERLRDALAARGIRLEVPQFPWERAVSSLSPLVGGTASAAGSVAQVLTRLSLMLVLSFYLLRDRERLAMQAELLVPSAYRRTAVRMARAVQTEMGTYLRGQALIALAVGALSALALMAVGVQGFLVLGLTVGLLNMIPYFGPLLGAIPAVLMALTQGSVQKALLSAGSLLAVQQVDNMLISPRVMGSVTGLHPAVVLVAITLGGSLKGVWGMLFAVPAALALRAVSRNWASRPISVAQNRTYY